MAFLAMSLTLCRELPATDLRPADGARRGVGEQRVCGFDDPFFLSLTVANVGRKRELKQCVDRCRGSLPEDDESGWLLDRNEHPLLCLMMFDGDAHVI